MYLDNRSTRNDHQGRELTGVANLLGGRLLLLGLDDRSSGVKGALLISLEPPADLDIHSKGQRYPRRSSVVDV